MAMLHKRQAPVRDIHRHFSLAPARSQTITTTVNSKAGATGQTQQQQTGKQNRQAKQQGQSALQSYTPHTITANSEVGRVLSWETRDTPHFNHDTTQQAARQALQQLATRPRTQTPIRQGPSSQSDVEGTTPVTHFSLPPLDYA